MINNRVGGRGRRLRVGGSARNNFISAWICFNIMTPVVPPGWQLNSPLDGYWKRDEVAQQHLSSLLVTLLPSSFKNSRD
jgi:hypothetical protein